ncbi:NfeD family protein [Sphingomonas sp. AOB5]|uniref:NfeD family protein n=1 Tax=Sphingomonas sp. AOB5 TaxID=3034017 RepID=UPI0023F72F3E|nr:NfeD family protein [Sphingomonas sp. AOB5]MDF7775978.1 NfeD family protein [Sphingomonas sp. AOB5]
MTEIQNLLSEPGIAWLALAAVLAIIELVMPGIFLVFIAAGAAVTGLIALVLPMPIFVEIGIFAVASSVAVAIGRRWYLKSPVPSSDPLLNDRVARLIGQTVTVSHAIVSGEGRVRVGDGEWPARGSDAPTGARVRVTGARDGSLDVEPVTN